ncbi:MAG: DNA mismatch repair endonuclease MutL [Buchnera aphidicola (Chaetogeoica yunlongensis)]
MLIRVLPLSVSSYISAGEIIYNPASVVKELVENSIDSCATRINIKIQKGGMQSILVQDNGCGMNAVDLKMSLMRHSTSKIYSMHDLKNVTTCGFRGEALASISAVSHMVLSSCDNCLSTTGWKIYSDGYGTISIPCIVPQTKGTTIIVLDLFFNRPVRRKSIISTYSEFLKIDDIVRCLSLSKTNLDISLTHNGKLIRHYNTFSKNLYDKNVVNSIYNIPGINEIIYIEHFFNHMKLVGWLYLLRYNSSLARKFQFFYVNKRIVFNKLFHHAVYQAVYEIGKNKYNISYIFYLELKFYEVDVNVHPEKKIIKLSNSRLVHSFIYRAIKKYLKTKIVSNSIIKSSVDFFKNKKDSFSIFNSLNRLFDKNSGLNKSQYDFIDTIKDSKSNLLKDNLELNFYKCEYNSIFSAEFGNILALINKSYLLIKKNNDKLFLFSLQRAKLSIYFIELRLGKHHGLKIKKLERVYIIFFKNNMGYKFFSGIQKILFHIGFDFCIKLEYIEFYSIPYMILNQDLSCIFENILFIFVKKNEITLLELISSVISHIDISVKKWDHLQILSVLLNFKRHINKILEFNLVSKVLKPIDINPVLNFFKDDFNEWT